MTINCAILFIFLKCKLPTPESQGLTMTNVISYTILVGFTHDYLASNSITWNLIY